MGNNMPYPHKTYTTLILSLLRAVRPHDHGQTTYTNKENSGNDIGSDRVRKRGTHMKKQGLPHRVFFSVCQFEGIIHAVHPFFFVFFVPHY